MENKVPWYIVTPSSRTKSAWDLVVLCAIVYTILMQPFSFGFEPGDREREQFGAWDTSNEHFSGFGAGRPLFYHPRRYGLDFVDAVVDVIFIVDFVVVFLTAFIGPEGKLIGNVVEIARHRMRSDIFFDLPSLFPFALFFQWFTANSFAKVCLSKSFYSRAACSSCAVFNCEHCMTLLSYQYVPQQYLE